MWCTICIKKKKEQCLQKLKVYNIWESTFCVVIFIVETFCSRLDLGSKNIFVSFFFLRECEMHKQFTLYIKHFLKYLLVKLCCY